MAHQPVPEPTLTLQTVKQLRTHEILHQPLLNFAAVTRSPFCITAVPAAVTISDFYESLTPHTFTLPLEEPGFQPRKRTETKPGCSAVPFALPRWPLVNPDQNTLHLSRRRLFKQLTGRFAAKANNGVRPQFQQAPTDFPVE